MKLRTKIKLFSCFFMLVFIVLINAAIYYLFYKTSIDAELDRIDAQTDVIMEALASNTNSDVNANNLLRAYVPANGMTRIVDDQKNVIQTVTKDTAFNRLPATFVQSETHDVTKREDGTRFATISVPLIWENGEVVTLQVVEQLSNLQATMATLFLVLLIASLLMIIPALIGGQLLGNFLLKPVQTLIAAMKENPREGEWKKIELNNRSQDELYQMGDTYNEMIDRLKESFNRQEQFVSDASHELKTPIAIITSYAQLLERWGREKPELFDEAIQAIQSEAGRMTQMTQQMLTLARNHNKKSLNFESTDILILCRETIRVFSVTYQRKIVLFTDLESLSISCDKEKINQVLYILVDNALKYSEKEVHLSVDKVEEGVTVSIQDFGEGLNETEINKIFDRFYRVDKARSRETGGTGLGLSIAQSIVRAHGGKISVTSKQREGTVFTVYLPY